MYRFAHSHFKSALSLVLALMIVFSCGAFGAALASSASTEEELPPLSPDNQSPVRPTIYSSPRYWDADKQHGYDLNGGLSAQKINNASGSREYGLYFKFTPRAGDDGYQINRIDVVVSNSDGEWIYVDGFDADVKCEYGYYWSWEFFPLAGLFYNMNLIYGKVISGRYTMDLYFNRLWAGSTTFRIEK